MEAVDHNQAGHRGTSPDGVGSRDGGLRGVQPAALFELGVVRGEYGAQSADAGDARSVGGFTQRLWVYSLCKQVADGGAQEVVEPLGFRDRFEVGGGAVLNFASNRSRKEFLGENVGWRLRSGSQPPAEMGNRLHAESQSHSASTDEAATELVAVAQGRYEHHRLGERIGLISSGQP